MATECQLWGGQNVQHFASAMKHEAASGRSRETDGAARCMHVAVSKKLLKPVLDKVVAGTHQRLLLWGRARGGCDRSGVVKQAEQVERRCRGCSRLAGRRGRRCREAQQIVSEGGLGRRGRRDVIVVIEAQQILDHVAVCGRLQRRYC